MRRPRDYELAFVVADEDEPRPPQKRPPARARRIRSNHPRMAEAVASHFVAGLELLAGQDARADFLNTFFLHDDDITRGMVNDYLDRIEAQARAKVDAGFTYEQGWADAKRTAR